MFYSYKLNNERWNMATTSQEKNAIKKERDILHIATTGGQHGRVSEATFNKAKRAYNLFKRLNRLNDRLLVIDNDARLYNRPHAQELHEEAEAMEATLRGLLKGFNLKIQYDSWLASLVDKKGYRIGLNFVA